MRKRNYSVGIYALVAIGSLLAMTARADAGR